MRRALAATDLLVSVLLAYVENYATVAAALRQARISMTQGDEIIGRIETL